MTTTVEEATLGLEKQHRRIRTPSFSDYECVKARVSVEMKDGKLNSQELVDSVKEKIGDIKTVLEVVQDYALQFDSTPGIKLERVFYLEGEHKKVAVIIEEDHSLLKPRGILRKKVWFLLKACFIQADPSSATAVRVLEGMNVQECMEYFHKYLEYQTPNYE